MASAAAVLAVCVALLAASAGADQLPKPSTPKSQNDNVFYQQQNSTLSGPFRGFTYGTNQLPADDPAFAHPADPDTPDQVKLTLVSPTEVWVTFTTGSPSNGTYTNTTGPPKAPLLPYRKPSTVYYGRKSGRFSYAIDASTPRNYVSTATVFLTNTSAGTNLYYISPFLYLAKLKDLEPNHQYFYYVKNSANPSAPPTKTFSFKTLREVGDDTGFKIAVIGDIGQTINTTDTLKHMAGNNPDLIYNMGDLTYADNSPNNDGNKWDNWGRLVSPYFSKWTHSTTNGNHELEQNEGNNQGTKQVQYNARYPQPFDASASDSNLYYSISHGPVHTLFLSQYTDYSKGSPQYAWASADIAAVDRSKTPWLFVVFHGPVYHTYVTHYKQYDCFRQVWEPLFNKAGVDLCMSGHVHAYERSNPVNNYTADATGCAPTYLTVGDGGNAERLYHSFVDGNATDNTPAGTDGCPTPVDNDVAADPQTCVSTKTQVPYCTPQQPPWSAYREDAFGHGILEIKDSTHATWSWYRNLDTLPVVTDSMVLQRDVRACPNRRQGAVLAPLPKGQKEPRKHGHHGHGHD